MYDSGQVKGLTQVKDGKAADGIITEWHENGQKKREGTVKDGELDGFQTTWHVNGQKSEEATYKEGKEDGLTTKWHENGQKGGEQRWKGGKVAETTIDLQDRVCRT